MVDMADDLQKRWKERYEQAKLRDDVDFDTLSSVEVDPLYGAGGGSTRSSAYPGEYPFTRGIYPSGYRGRLWTMRQFAGFGTADETNERFKFLIDHGQTGLSVAFDMPTLMGRDSDDPHSLGEVGRCGVAVDSLADMEILFDGIDLEAITTSMTISGPGPHAVRDVHRGRREAGGRRLEARRHVPDRHPEGVHRSEGVAVPAGAASRA